MASGKIAKRTVDEFIAAGVEGFLWDSDLKGFGLRSNGKGAATYILSFRMGGREAAKRRYTIGRHGSPWTPVTARAEADRISLLIAQGVDPMEADKERRRQAVDLAFSSYLKTFREKHLDQEWARAAEAERILVREAVPILGAKPLPSIKKADIVAVMDRVADRPGTADLTFALLRKLFAFAEGRGEIERTPFIGMKPPRPPASRDRVLSDSELSRVWRAVGGMDWPWTPFFRLLVLTGQRREEVAGIDWAELDRGPALWTLPGTRAKNGKAHLIPIGAEVLAIIDGIAKGDEWPRKGLTFSTTGTTAISGFSRAKARLDTLITKAEAKAAEDEGREPEGMPPWRIHDLRRTVATGLQRLGVRLEVTEAVLNHVSGSRAGIVGVYQRHTWADEKRAALAAWGAHVAAIVTSEEGA